MTIIFGLGNPEEKYRNTRHNVGAEFLNHLITSYSGNFREKKKLFSLLYQSNTDQLALVKPTTFMNESGRAVYAVLKYYNLDPSDKKNTIFVAYDDLDIDVGHFKLQFGKGPKVHNGLNSVVNYLHTDQFWHIRIGIDGRAGHRNVSGKEYVLEPFIKDEKSLVKTAFDEIDRMVKEKANLSISE